MANVAPMTHHRAHLAKDTMTHPAGPTRAALSRLATLLALMLAAVLALVLGACTPGAQSGPDPDGAPTSAGAGGATDSFPVTVEHTFGSTTVEAEPQRVVVVGITEPDILLELGVVPVATTEWYGEQPHAVWPWAQELLGGATPEVLSTSDGFEFEKVAALEPDLIVGTNSGMTAEDYERFSAIAPTITGVQGSEPYFSDWREQTRQVAKAVGRSAAGDELIAGVEQAYADAASEHPQFAGLTVTFSQATPSEGVIWVYPDGLNTDFLTDLGFTITPGLQEYAPAAGEQAQIAEENVHLLEADVVVFATESADGIDDVLSFGTMENLPAVKEHRAVFTDATLAGAIYFLTPLSQKYVLEHLVPRLEDAVEAKAPRSVEG